MLLSLLVITSPAHDVLPIVCTDYTYDSELDITDGVPQKCLDAAPSSRRGTHMYEMCWSRLEETLFKEDTKNIREILSAEIFSALFLCLK